MSKRKRSSVTDLTPLQRRRLSWAIAKGAPIPKAAERSGLRTPEVQELAEDKGFSCLIEAYRTMASLPEDERHKHLVAMAQRVLREALIFGGPGVALFILKQRTRQRCPAEVLAEGVIKSLERQTASASPNRNSTKARPKRQTELSCPVDNATNRAAATLRAQILEEIEIEALAQAPPKHQSDQRPSWSISDLSPKHRALLASWANRNQQISHHQPETDPANPNAPNG